MGVERDKADSVELRYVFRLISIDRIHSAIRCALRSVSVSVRLPMPEHDERYEGRGTPLPLRAEFLCYLPRLHPPLASMVFLEE